MSDICIGFLVDLLTSSLVCRGRDSAGVIGRHAPLTIGECGRVTGV